MFHFDDDTEASPTVRRGVEANDFDFHGVFVVSNRRQRVLSALEASAFRSVQLLDGHEAHLSLSLSLWVEYRSALWATSSVFQLSALSIMRAPASETFRASIQSFDIGHWTRTNNIRFLFSAFDFSLPRYHYTPPRRSLLVDSKTPLTFLSIATYSATVNNELYGSSFLFLHLTLKRLVRIRTSATRSSLKRGVSREFLTHSTINTVTSL